MKNFYYSQFSILRSGKIWQSFLLLLLLTAFNPQHAIGQVNGYQFSQLAGSYTAATNPTIVATATANSGAIPALDTAAFPVTLPFGFVFNGQTYTDVNMSSNGYIVFGSGTATTVSPISSTIGWNGVISAWGRDIIAVYDIAGKTGNMSISVEGTAPNRTAVLQWENFRPSYTTTTTSAYVFSFQIRLKETSNVISTTYSAGAYLVGSASYSGTAQIGLRGATNTDFNNRLNATGINFDASTTGTANSSGQAFSTTANPPGTPSDGLTYIWTPPTCLGPNTLSVSNITTNSVTLSWLASVSAPANGYDIYYSTINTPPVATTTPNFSGIAGLTQNIGGLNSSSTYYVWVRSVCSASDASNWVALPTFNTACGPINNMFENFDSYSTGSIVPNCWDRIISGTGTQTISSGTPNSAPNNLYQYSGTPANATIVVMPVFGNVNAGTHWVRLKARVTTAPRTIEFGYVTNATDATSFVLLESKAIVSTAYTASNSEYTFTVPTTVPANARLAIRNPGTLATTLYYDDVYWEAAPTCLPPSNLSSTATSPTAGNVMWNASTTVPGNGYQVYYSTSSTPPTAATAPNITGVNALSSAINGLLPSTAYYVWVRSACSASDLSTWSSESTTFSTPCLPPAITSTTPATICGPSGIATISATADAGAVITWYDAATAGNTLATASSYTTPVLTATTTYYVSAQSGGATGTVGPVSPSSVGTVSATNYAISTYYQSFDVTTPTVLTSIDVYPVSSVTLGTASAIEIRDNSGAVLVSVPYTVAVNDGVTPQTVPLNFALPVGTGYRIGQGIAINLNRNTSGAVYPYTSSAITVTGNNFAVDYWYYIYNWKFTSSCESTRQAVVVTVDAACLSTNEVDEKNNLNVYPNPFADVLNISDIKNVLSVSISDLSGRVVKTIAKPSAQLHLGELKTGMYLVTFKYKDGSVKAVKAIKK